MVVLDGVSGPEREGRGGSQKHEIIVSSSVASFCIPHSEFRPPGGQRILEIYDQADGSLPTVLPMVVLDGVSGRERGREPFTENPKGYNGTYYYCSGAPTRFLVASGAVRPPDAPLAVDACDTRLYTMLQG